MIALPFPAICRYCSKKMYALRVGGSHYYRCQNPACWVSTIRQDCLEGLVTAAVLREYGRERHTVGYAGKVTTGLTVAEYWTAADWPARAARRCRTRPGCSGGTC